MSLTKLSLAGKYFNYSRPGRVWSGTSCLGTGKPLTFFYSVALRTFGERILFTGCAVCIERGEVPHGCGVEHGHVEVENDE